MHEFIYRVDHVLIDEIRARDIDQHEGIFPHPFQFFLYDRFVEERYILSQADKVFVVIVYDHHSRAEIASYQEEQRHSHADQDPDEEIGEEDSDDRDYEWDKLVPTPGVQFPEQRGFCQFIAG